MKLEHNLEPDELAMSLAGIILSEGVEDQVLDNLSKSKRGGGETPQEPDMRSLISTWKNQHRSLIAELKRTIDFWVESKRTTVLRDWWFFSSEVQNVLRIEDVLELEELIYKHYKDAAFTAFSGITMDAYNRGRKSGTRMMASTYAGLHTGGYVAGLGSRVSSRVLQAGIEGLQSNYPGTVAHFVNRNKNIDDWGALGKKVKEIISDADWKRDMDRIGATELRWSYNTGVLQNLVSQGYDKVFYQVQPTACANCRRLLLHPDGRPKVLPIRALLMDINSNGGMNIGRSEEQWRPTACIHPHCHCQIMPYRDED